MTRTEQMVCNLAEAQFGVPADALATALEAPPDRARASLAERLDATGLLAPPQVNALLAAACDVLRRASDHLAPAKAAAGPNGAAAAEALPSRLRRLVARLDRALAAGGLDGRLRLAASGTVDAAPAPAPAPAAGPAPVRPPRAPDRELATDKTRATLPVRPASPETTDPLIVILDDETGGATLDEVVDGAPFRPTVGPDPIGTIFVVDNAPAAPDTTAGPVPTLGAERVVAGDATMDEPPATHADPRGTLLETAAAPVLPRTEPAAGVPSTHREGATPPPKSTPPPGGGEPAAPLTGAAAALAGLEKYEILKEIGRGGMGIVYKARQRGLGRTVCLKVMRGGQLAGNESRRRFLREAESAARLQHPNIVPVHDVGEHEGMVFFSMDFVEGVELGDWITENKPSPQDLARVLVKVCDAIQYAHLRGVIHRDLKPQNVMMDRAGEPHVMDFGIAKTVDAAAEGEPRPATMTQEGAVMGTPHYMSPEQAQGLTSDIDVRTDVYTLGVIGFELFTGKLPFEADNVYQVLEQVIQADPPLPTALRPELDLDLETIVLKAMEKEKERRYQTAEELREDLQRWLDGDPIQARRASLVYRWKKRIQKHRGVALAVAGGCVAVLGVLGLGAAKVYLDARRAAAEVDAIVTAAEGELQAGRLEEAVLGFGAALARDPGHARALDRRVEAALQFAKASVAEGAPGRAEFVLRTLEASAIRADEVAAQLEVARKERTRLLDVGVERQKRYVERTTTILEKVAALPPGRELAFDEEQGHTFDLIAMRDEKTVAILATAVSGADASPDPRVRLLAARALGGMGERAAVPALGVLAADVAADERLRLVAAEALGRLGGRDATAALVAARRAADPVFRRRTDGALRQAQQGAGDEGGPATPAGADGAAAEAADAEEKRLAALFADADRLRLAGQSKDAADRYSEALALAPDAVEGYLGRGLALLDLRRDADAEEDLSRVLRAPGSARGPALLNRAEARRRQGNVAGALEDLDALLTAEPRRADAHLARGILRLGSGDVAGARAALDEALRQRNGYVEAHIARAEARLEVRPALEARPGVEARPGLDRDLAGALADAEAAVAAEPEKPEGWLVRARVRLESGDLARALADADQVLTMSRGGALGALALVVRGSAALRTGDAAAAQADFVGAAEAAPTLAPAHRGLARARAALGALDAACDALAAALAQGDVRTTWRDDPDLKPLHGHPRFESLCAGR